MQSRKLLSGEFKTRTIIIDGLTAYELHKLLKIEIDFWGQNLSTPSQRIKPMIHAIETSIGKAP